ncbi:restriction endonuclease subunit S [Acinetobacter towneri]|uniref:restriction endonuclease subunit S n=1 Tax=Acinetobacter towneri TaxID=202956 RepID=UPI002576B1CB|nr:restriction endonuclease subunit S [Acinetobacter towneri]MDM1721356.1 restriction endonuclease subunit S [Acinetobacter towneri]
MDNQVVMSKFHYLKVIDSSKLEEWSYSYLIERENKYNQDFEMIRIGDFLLLDRDVVIIEDEKKYNRVTVKINTNGVVKRDSEIGQNIGTKRQFLAKEGQFILSKIDARNGAFGIVPPELDGAIVTNDFPLFSINTDKVKPQFFFLLTGTKEFINFAKSCSSGTTNRQRIDVGMFLNQKIPLPEISIQENIVKNYFSKIEEANKKTEQAYQIEKNIEEYLFNYLGISERKNSMKKTGIQVVDFKNISAWGLDKILNNQQRSSSKYSLVSVEERPNICEDLFRGKSPKYKGSTDRYILNQKCNRWNKIDLSFVKAVDENWLNSIDSKFFTREGDILINSTGEGTIGRATCITKEYEGLLYDSHLLLLRLNKNLINPHFFVALLHKPSIKSLFSNIISK